MRAAHHQQYLIALLPNGPPLAAWAYEKLADKKWGVIGLQWRDVDCNYRPQKRARVPSWSSPTPMPSWEQKPYGWNWSWDRRPKWTQWGAGRRLRMV